MTNNDQKKPTETLTAHDKMHQGPNPHDMSHQEDSQAHDAPQHELHFDDSVIAKIVALTVKDISGLYQLEGNMIANVTDKLRKTPDPTKGVDVDVDDDKRVNVNLDATLHYGEPAPEIFDQVTEEVTERVHELTGLTVEKIEMTVKDMLTEDEIAALETDTAQADDDDKELEPVR